MNTDGLVEIAKQVPSLACLIWIVYYFVGATLKLVDNHTARMEQVTKDYRETVTDYKHTVEKNSQALSNVCEVLARIEARSKS